MSKAQSPVHSGGNPPVALIAGPTASGKSDLAVKLAQGLEARGRRAVVINADSQQVYRDLRVLSARPSEDEMGGIEHRLLGTWDGATPCSAAEWADAAKREIAALHGKGAVPILCGGTGLYMRTLLDGISPVPPIDPVIREEVRRLGAPELRAYLLQEDPAAAARLGENDIQRMSRALEVIRSTGQSLTAWQSKSEGGIAEQITLFPVVLLPDRDELYDRCDRRFEAMLDEGAIAEVEGLLSRGLAPTLPVMRAIGVPEIAGMLDGRVCREEAVAAGQLATRQYAKRQYTWFRNQPPESWLRTRYENVELETLIENILRN